MTQAQETAEARVVHEIETGRPDEIGQFLLKHLAEWGPGSLDVGALARRVLESGDAE
jgi:hypothetical protein